MGNHIVPTITALCDISSNSCFPAFFYPAFRPPVGRAVWRPRRRTLLSTDLYDVARAARRTTTPRGCKALPTINRTQPTAGIQAGSLQVCAHRLPSVCDTVAANYARRLLAFGYVIRQTIAGAVRWWAVLCTLIRRAVWRPCRPYALRYAPRGNYYQRVCIVFAFL